MLSKQIEAVVRHSSFVSRPVGTTNLHHRECTSAPEPANRLIDPRRDRIRLDQERHLPGKPRRGRGLHPEPGARPRPGALRAGTPVALRAFPSRRRGASGPGSEKGRPGLWARLSRPRRYVQNAALAAYRRQPRAFRRMSLLRTRLRRLAQALRKLRLGPRLRPARLLRVPGEDGGLQETRDQGRGASRGAASAAHRPSSMRIF